MNRQKNLLKLDSWSRNGFQRIGFNAVRFKIAQIAKPCVNKTECADDAQALVRDGIKFQIFAGQFKQCHCRQQPVFLQMNKRARQLDKPLVEITVGTVPVREPQILQYVVSLVKFLLVEERKVTGISRINAFHGKFSGQFRDALMFVHAASLGLKPAAESPKSRD